MTRNLYISEINSVINNVDTKKLKEILNFANYVKFKDNIEPTIEIIGDKDYYKNVKAGIKDFDENNVLDWDLVK